VAEEAREGGCGGPAGPRLRVWLGRGLRTPGAPAGAHKESEGTGWPGVASRNNGLAGGTKERAVSAAEGDPTMGDRRARARELIGE